MALPNIRLVPTFGWTTEARVNASAVGLPAQSQGYVVWSCHRKNDNYEHYLPKAATVIDVWD